ncbi:MAG: molybdenum cofactor guanylyltransferase MobA [Methylovirgula sp.]
MAEIPHQDTAAHEKTAGILLAGGRATRMGGSDKSLKLLGGTPILSRVIAALQPQCDALLINANGDPARFAPYRLPVVADDVMGFAGPLAGILAGLDFIAAHLPEIRFAVSIATDTPFLPSDLVVRLHAARQQDQADVACATSGGSTHHVMALWPVAIAADLRHALVAEDIRAVQRFTARYKIAYADWPCVPYDPFFNANEPADIDAAEAILLQL